MKNIRRWSAAWRRSQYRPGARRAQLGSTGEDAAGRASARAAQIGTLTRIAHEMLISEETQRLLDDARGRDRRRGLRWSKPAWCGS
ncbi:MAG: hypothetical protein U0703_08690 [Anaerolineae bacterium]